MITTSALRPLQHAIAACLLLAASAAAHAADITWTDAGGDGQYSTPNNWSGSAVPGSGDQVTFDNTSTSPCTIDIAATVGSVVVSATYSGSIVQNNAFTDAGDFSLSGGSWSSGATLTIGGSVSIAATPGLFSSTSTVALTGSGNLSSPANPFSVLQVGAASQTTTLVGDAVVTSLCQVGSGQLVFTNFNILHLRGAGDLLSVTGSLNAISPNRGVVAYEATSSSPVHVAGGDYGYVQLQLVALGGVTADFEQQGDISALDSVLTGSNEAGANMTWNLNNHNLTSASWMSVGDWSASPCGTTLNAGSGTITAPSLTWFTTGSDAINLQSSTWVVGEWAVWDSSAVIDPGTSSVTVNNGIGPFWTVVPHQFYDLHINGSCPLYGPIAVAHDLTVENGGTLITNDLAVSTGADLVVQTGGVLQAGASAIAVGANVSIANQDGAFVAGTSSVTVSGPGTISDPDQNNPFDLLVVAAAGQTVYAGTDITTTSLCTVLSGTFDLHTGPSTGSASVLHLQGVGTVLNNHGSIWGGASAGGLGTVSYEGTGQNSSSSTAMLIDGGSYGYSSFRLVALNGANAFFSQTGDVFNTDDIYTAGTAAGSIDWTTNGHNITSSSWLSVGNWGGGTGTSLHCGSSVITIPALSWFTTSADVLDLQESTWWASDWGFWSPSGQCLPGSSMVHIIGGSIGIPWASIPQTFYNLDVDAAGDDAQVYGALSVAGNLSVTAGTLDLNGNNAVVDGNVSVASASGLVANAETIELAGTGAQSCELDGASVGTLTIDANTSTRTVGLGPVSLGTLAVQQGVTVVVDAASTVGVTNALTLTGTAAFPITMRSSMSGSTWNLDVSTGATQSLAYVAAQDSIGTGAQINDSASGFNLGNNTNWLFTSSTGPSITSVTASPTFTTSMTTTVSCVATDSLGLSSLSYTWSATGPGLVSFSPNGTNAAQTATATFSQAGDYVITVIVSDTAQQATSGTVNATAATAPSFAIGPSEAMAENGGTVTFPSWVTGITAGAPGGSTVSFLVSSSNGTLFTQTPTIDAAGNLSVSIAANQIGSSVLTVQAQDVVEGTTLTSASQTATLVVCVPPSFTAGPNETIAMCSAPQTFTGWATNITPGSPSGSAVSFQCSVSNPNLFASLPTIDASGNLTVAVSANQDGTSTVSVVAVDVIDGVTAMSQAQSVTITVPSSGTDPNVALLDVDFVTGDPFFPYFGTVSATLVAYPPGAQWTESDFGSANIDDFSFTESPPGAYTFEASYNHAPGFPDENGVNVVTANGQNAIQKSYTVYGEITIFVDPEQDLPPIIPPPPPPPPPPTKPTPYPPGPCTPVASTTGDCPQNTSSSCPTDTSAGDTAPAPNSGSGAPAVNQDGVLAGDGSVEFSASDLASGGMGGFSVARTYNNLMSTSSSSAGANWYMRQEPTIVLANAGNLNVVVSPRTSYRFTSNGSTFTPTSFSTATLSHAGTLYTFTDTNGNVTTFNDFTVMPTALQGHIAGFSDRGGNQTVYNYNVDGVLTSTQNSVTVAGVTTTNTYSYLYNSSGFVSSISWSQQIGSASAVTVRTVAYTYYTGASGDFGLAGQLASATEMDASSNVLDQSVYRYWIASDSPAYLGGIKYVVNPRNVAQMVQTSLNPITCTNAQLVPYANLYYNYNSSGQVIESKIVGTGCSCAGNNSDAHFTYFYLPQANVGPNAYASKTTINFLDFSGNVLWTKNVYCNDGMQPIFEALTADGITTCTAKTYDAQYNLIQIAEPTAISSYDDCGGTMLTVTLNASAGLIHNIIYGSSTSATATTAGSALRYLDHYSDQQGSSGTPITTQSFQYFAHTDGLGNLTYPIASQTQYRNTDGTGAETTSYAYTYQGSTSQIYQKTTTMPTVPTSENGSGSPDTMAVAYDIYGRTIWEQDGDGYLTYRAYDQTSGSLIQLIRDVNSASFTVPLPTGWSGTPTGGGLNLVTDYTVDALGRASLEVDPEGTEIATVYDDVSHASRIYPGWDPIHGATTGPIALMRNDYSNNYDERLTFAASPTTTGSAGSLLPSGEESISNIQTLSRTLLDYGQRQIEQDNYVSFSGVTWSSTAQLGTLGENYYQLLFGYDELGNRERVQNQVGTISHTIHDHRNRIISTWVGTNDTPMTGFWSPTNDSAPANLIQTEGRVWDNGGIGDGTLTLVTLMPTGNPTDNRVTQNFYDWRDRRVASKSGVHALGPSYEDTNTHRPLAVCQLDNLGECVLLQRYDCDQWMPSIASGILSGLIAGDLRAQTATAYDECGRAYQSNMFGVDQGSGSVSSTGLTTNYYFNHRDLVMSTCQPGGEVKKRQFDGISRVAMQSTTDGAAGQTWSAMLSTAGDHVFSQLISTYDGNGNVLLVTNKERFHSETGTGDLGGPSSSPLSRTSYRTAYYDLANRAIASVDYGTNGGAAFTIADRPSSTPTASDSVLVTSQTYSQAGWVQTRTDPRNITTFMGYDALGRSIEQIEAWDGTSSPQPIVNENRITLTSYDGLGHVILLTAENASPSNSKVTFQQTGYLYGVHAPGSAITSNDLLSIKMYPDPATGQPSAQSANQERYTYLSTGQRNSSSDGNGNVHAITYDVLGRPTSDHVDTLGSGVDGNVRRLDTAYDTGDRAYLFTSFADIGGTIVANQVQRQFNGLGQLQQEWQATAGAVNTSSTPSVQYAYTYLSGGVNNSRLTNMTYPNGRKLDVIYNVGLDATISRVSALADDSGSSVGVQDEAYAYLGISRIVQRTQVEPSIISTLIQQSGDSLGDGGDVYTGLDRFTRVIDSRWINTSIGPTSRLQYAYDRASEKLYENNTVNTAFSVLYHGPGDSEATAYDHFSRLQNVARGTLSASGANGMTLDTIASPTDPTHGANPVYGTQSWDLDQLGNWTSVTSDGTADARTHNLQNELTADDAGALGYDNNGNLTTQADYTANTYDAWNRATSIRGVMYSYNALNNRIWESDSGGRAFFYDGMHMIETRLGATDSLASSANEQYVYGQGNTDDVVLRDADVNGGGNLGITGSALDQRVYYQQDRELNVVALVDQGGSVIERYAYDPYGSQSALHPNWSLWNDGADYGNQVGFTGRWLDHTGMVYFRARYLEPVVGRFVNRDPKGYVNGMNPYNEYFVPNGTDPTGTICCQCGSTGKPHYYTGNSGKCPSDETQVADSSCPTNSCSCSCGIWKVVFEGGSFDVELHAAIGGGVGVEFWEAQCQCTGQTGTFMFGRAYELSGGTGEGVTSGFPGIGFGYIYGETAPEEGSSWSSGGNGGAAGGGPSGGVGVNLTYTQGWGENVKEAGIQLNSGAGWHLDALIKKTVTTSVVCGPDNPAAASVFSLVPPAPKF